MQGQISPAVLADRGAAMRGVTPPANFAFTEF
jgi:hypothetical protein